LVILFVVYLVAVIFTFLVREAAIPQNACRMQVDRTLRLFVLDLTGRSQRPTDGAHAVA
jgi:hypothetical protein